MIAIFRTSKNTLDEVVHQAKYALRGEPNLNPGDLILLAQTVTSITDDKPPIRYRMQFVRAYKDLKGESKRIWGKQWNYMVEGANCRLLKTPFDIREYQVTDKNYAQGGTIVYVEPEDEVVLRKQGLLDALELEKSELAPIYNPDHKTKPELQEPSPTYPGKQPGFEDIRTKVREFNDRYRDAAPQYRRKLSKQIARPGGISDYLKRWHDFICQLCKVSGFQQEGGTKYAEAHHIIELHQLIPGSYCSDNIIVVCPTCHRKLHYALVKYDKLSEEHVAVEINGEKFSFTRNILPK